MQRRRTAALVLLVCSAGTLFGQVPPRVEALIAAVRPALPFPAASADGALPAEGGAEPRWFVQWPAADSLTITVKSNPLHPETQKLGATADVPIQQAVAAAQRKAQAAYDRALEELKRAAAAADFDVVDLDDEGIAGERIDAELELTIELETSAGSFVVESSEEPVVSAGAKGVAWVVTIPPNAYRPTSGSDRREHFRPAESRLYFGALSRPSVTRDPDQRFNVSIPPAQGAFAVVLRGNHDLQKRVVAAAEWGRLARP